MKILVTGGAGFIGSCFIRQMLSKYDDIEIINLDNLSYCANLNSLKTVENDERCVFIKGDINDFDLVLKLMKKVDCVVNFAAESHVDNSFKNQNLFVKTNILGTVNLLNCALKCEIEKFIQISTDEVYGEIIEGSVDENAQIKPNNPYSISKASGDMFALNYFKTYDLPVIITRSSNNFGEFQYIEKLIPLFVFNLLHNKKVPLYGTGLQMRDWLYVEDNVDAIDLILKKGEIGEIYNISSNTIKTNLEITKKILKYLNKSTDMIEYVADRPLHDKRYSIDSTKIKNLGWSSKFDFDDALKKTTDWYKDNINYFKR